jgi:DNA-binding transcriptional LysR family regulator
MYSMMQEGAHRSIEPLLERAAVRPRVPYRFSHVISILGIVQQGLGVSIAPAARASEQYPCVVYRPLEPRAPRRVALAMRDIAELSPVACVFVELAERWARRRRAAQ